MLIGSSWLDGDAIWRYFFSPRKCSRQFRRVFFSSTNPLPNPTIYDKDTNLNAFEAASSKVWCRMCTRGFSQMAKWLKISVILGGLFCFFFLWVAQIRADNARMFCFYRFQMGLRTSGMRSLKKARYMKGRPFSEEPKPIWGLAVEVNGRFELLAD